MITTYHWDDLLIIPANAFLPLIRIRGRVRGFIYSLNRPLDLPTDVPSGLKHKIASDS
jgi:hypothetical protein